MRFIGINHRFFLSLYSSLIFLFYFPILMYTLVVTLKVDNKLVLSISYIHLVLFVNIYFFPVFFQSKLKEISKQQYLYLKWQINIDQTPQTQETKKETDKSFRMFVGKTTSAFNIIILICLSIYFSFPPTPTAKKILKKGEFPPATLTVK